MTFALSLHRNNALASCRLPLATSGAAWAGTERPLVVTTTQVTEAVGVQQSDPVAHGQQPLE